VAEGGGLLNRYTGLKPVSWVRIPSPPPTPILSRFSAICALFRRVADTLPGASLPPDYHRKPADLRARRRAAASRTAREVHRLKLLDARRRGAAARGAQRVPCIARASSPRLELLPKLPISSPLLSWKRRIRWRMSKRCFSCSSHVLIFGRSAPGCRSRSRKSASITEKLACNRQDGSFIHARSAVSTLACPAAAVPALWNSPASKMAHRRHSGLENSPSSRKVCSSRSSASWDKLRPLRSAASCSCPLSAAEAPMLSVAFSPSRPLVVGLPRRFGFAMSRLCPVVSLFP
jgi:hypothetical protein